MTNHAKTSKLRHFRAYSLEAGIWASRLGFESGGGWTEEKKKEKEKKEK